MLNLLPIVSIFSLGLFLCRFFNANTLLRKPLMWFQIQMHTWLSDWLIHMMLRNYENESIFLWTFANKYELTTNKSLWFSLIYARIDRLCRRLYTVIQDAVWATFFRENDQECSWGDVCYSVISSHTHTHTPMLSDCSLSLSRQTK